MQRINRRLVFASLLLVGLFWIGLSADRNRSSTGGLIPAPQKGFLAPEFNLSTLDGQSVKLSDLRGNIVLVNFWATWCPPCRAEMPAVEKVYNSYKDQGFVVLAVNSTVQDTFTNVAPFAQQFGLSFPILLDRTGDVSHLYMLRSLPTSFFVDRDGIIREVVIGGPMSEALLRSRVEQLLQE